MRRNLSMHHQTIKSVESANHQGRACAAQPQHSAERLCLSGAILKVIRRGYASAFAVLCLALLIAASANAQRRAAQPANAISIPSPRSVFGFNPGDDRTIIDWKQITDYFTRLDKASDRVQVETIGTTTLGRTMIAAFISAPENIRNLDKYKAIQARLADPRKVAGDAERDQLIRDGKTVVVISCSIHSTEIVASQMSSQLAYNLATANDPDTLSILHNTI